MPARVFRRPDVEEMTGLSCSSIYEMMARGDFPKPIRIGRRAVAWREADLNAWFETREPAAA
ncbi:helix-turn-helix transcriptional regulator [Roseivivax sediminis]|uniref:helix-turn-helix transcriptional regulator n=1 Tax=Roseivivax sediminis TaxID=936889 RepID=UPI00122D2742|nr:AlpA family phage regulatory protein [Roseivivax sediminis]